MKLFRKMKKGFTLVELVVVIAVIVILAAVSVGAFFGVTESAKASQQESEAKQLYDAVLIVGNSNSSNHSIDKDGLHIVDIEVFEDAVNEVTGGNYEVYEEDATAIAGDAIVLKTGNTSGLAGAKTYKSFEYYTPETGNNAGVVDVISGEYTRTTNNNITVETIYTTADEVNKAIKKASTDVNNPTLIKLGASMVFDDNLCIDGKAIILDLNGYTITAKQVNGVNDTEGENHNDLFVLRAINGANVIVTGNGKLHFASDTTGAAAIVGCYEGSVVTIKNGTFECNPIEGGTVLYTRGDALINVEGGSFDPVKKYVGNGIDRYFLFNKTCTTTHCDDLTEDGGWSSSHNGHCNEPHFNVTGGTFYRTGEGLVENYVNGCSHNFVAEGYAAHAVDGAEIPTFVVTRTAN